MLYIRERLYNLEIYKKNFRINLFSPKKYHHKLSFELRVTAETCLQASVLRKLSHAMFKGRESNLLGIKAIHERSNISKELV